MKHTFQKVNQLWPSTFITITLLWTWDMPLQIYYLFSTLGLSYMLVCMHFITGFPHPLDSGWISSMRNLSPRTEKRKGVTPKYLILSWKFALGWLCLSTESHLRAALSTVFVSSLFPSFCPKGGNDLDAMLPVTILYFGVTLPLQFCHSLLLNPPQTILCPVLSVPFVFHWDLTGLWCMYVLGIPFPAHSKTSIFVIQQRHLICTTIIYTGGDKKMYARGMCICMVCVYIVLAPCVYKLCVCV